MPAESAACSLTSLQFPKLFPDVFTLGESSLQRSISDRLKKYQILSWDKLNDNIIKMG